MSETKRPYGSRFRDAMVIINPGACNPSGVAPSIADACREIPTPQPPPTSVSRGGGGSGGSERFQPELGKPFLAGGFPEQAGRAASPAVS
jgi:hypothetical protein